jgi:hypothetical protein
MSNAMTVKNSGRSRGSLVMIEIDPGRAAKMIEADHYAGQRNLRPWHVNELAEAMSRGKFTEGTQIHFCKHNGKKYNVNGNHTLHAVVKSGVTINLGILMTEVETDEEIADHYSRHDRHLARTLGDAVKAHGVEAKLGLTGKQITVANYGIKMILSEFANARRGNTYEIRAHDERVSMLLNEYGDEAKGYFDAIKGCSKLFAAPLMTAAVVGVALLTFKKDPEKAKSFWMQVATGGGGLNVGDPRRSLMVWLQDNPLKIAPSATRARVVAKAWNVFVAGGSVIRFKNIDISTPVVV